MTVLLTSASSGPFTPDGIVTAYPFTFAALTASEVMVVRRSALNVDTPLTGYTIALGYPGGTVNFSVAPIAGDPIYVLSNPAFTQQITFANQGAFSPTTLNEVADRSAIRDIYLYNRLSAAIVGISTNIWGTLTGSLSAQTDLQGALDAKEPVIAAGTTGQYLNGVKTFQTLDKGAVGLGNVDNTSDLNKPVSTAAQAALNAKPSLTGAAFTGALTATNLSGTNTGDQTITLTGDVSGSGTGSFTTTIGAGAVGLSKIIPIGGLTILGNNTGASANPLALPVASVAAILPLFGTTANGLTPQSPGGSATFLAADGVWRTPSVNVGSVAWGAITGTLSSQTDLSTALAGKAALTGATFTGSITATNLSGTNTGDQTITLTGDVTGTGTGSFASTIGANKVTYAKFVAATAASFVAASAAGNFAETTPATARSILGLATVATSGSADDITAGTLLVARGGTGVTTSTGTGSVVLSISPTLTGAPLAPTAAGGTSTTQIATTAFVAAGFATTAAVALKQDRSPAVQTPATSAASIVPTFSNDAVNLTGHTVAIAFANWSGTAIDFYGLVLRAKDNGTARAITYGTNYLAADGLTLPVTTVVGKTHELAFEHNTATGKHVCVAVLTY